MNTHVRHNFSQWKGRMVSLLRLAPDFPTSSQAVASQEHLLDVQQRGVSLPGEVVRLLHLAESWWVCGTNPTVHASTESVDLSYFEIPCPFQLLFKKEMQTDLKTWKLYLHLLYHHSAFFTVKRWLKSGGWGKGRLRPGRIQTRWKIPELSLWNTKACWATFLACREFLWLLSIFFFPLWTHRLAPGSYYGEANLLNFPFHTINRVCSVGVC